MRRREFIAGIGSAAAWPVAARAQQGERVMLSDGLANMPACLIGMEATGEPEGPQFTLSGGGSSMFERVLWQSDRALLENLVFRLEHYKNDRWELGDRCFAFFKIKELIDQYERAFSHRPGLRPRHLLEIGMWDGGSLAFWNEILHPEKIVGVDLNAREDSVLPGLRAGPGSGIEGAVLLGHRSGRRTGAAAHRGAGVRGCSGHGDRRRLAHLRADPCELSNPVSVAAGGRTVHHRGLGVWEHWKEFHSPFHPWAWSRSPTPLVFELIEATGTSQHLITSVEVFQGFIIVERGPAPASDVTPLILADQIARRSPVRVPHALYRVLRALYRAPRALYRALTQ